MKIEWQEYLSVGVAEIDYQHKQLFNKYNAFFSAYHDGRGDEEIIRLFYFLGYYVASHFADEERLMQQVDFPDYQRHHQQHLVLTNKVAEFKERLGKEGVTADLISAAGLLMTGWLIEHISVMDRAIGRFIKEREQ